MVPERLIFILKEDLNLLLQFNKFNLNYFIVIKGKLKVKKSFSSLYLSLVAQNFTKVARFMFFLRSQVERKCCTTQMFLKIKEFKKPMFLIRNVSDNMKLFLMLLFGVHCIFSKCPCDRVLPQQSMFDKPNIMLQKQTNFLLAHQTEGERTFLPGSKHFRGVEKWMMRMMNKFNLMCFITHHPTWRCSNLKNSFIRPHTSPSNLANGIRRSSSMTWYYLRDKPISQPSRNACLIDCLAWKLCHFLGLRLAFPYWESMWSNKNRPYLEIIGFSDRSVQMFPVVVISVLLCSKAFRKQIRLFKYLNPFRSCGISLTTQIVSNFKVIFNDFWRAKRRLKWFWIP